MHVDICSYLTELLLSSEDDMNDDDDFEEVDDVCPFGCEPALYDKIIDLREKRCFIDDNINDIQVVLLIHSFLHSHNRPLASISSIIEIN